MVVLEITRTKIVNIIPMKSSFICVISVVILSVVASSCKSKISDEKVIPESELYSRGLKFLDQKKYDKASEEFEKIFFQHPGKEITAQAELMQAYSLYLNGKYDEATDILDVFIKLHPRHSDIAYAYYLKALSNYNQIADVELDLSRATNAKKSFEDVIKLFPDTKYATDASLKLDLINDTLAAKSILIGRYYLKRSNPIAAIPRFQSVIRGDFQTTAHAPEALYRLVEANLMLGLQDEAQKYAAILGHNYPQSDWYKYSYDLLK